MIVLAFNDAKAFAEHKQFDLAEVASAWKFRTGDCLVAGISPGAGKPGVAADKSGFLQRHFMFNAAWGAESPVVGQIARPLDRGQILRLRAAAIRQVAGTDVGLIWKDGPDYLRWSDCLPAGPVTVADLATLDGLPEYVMVGRMTGSQLCRLKPAASTIVKDATDPLYKQGQTLAADESSPRRSTAWRWGVGEYRRIVREPKRLPALIALR